MIYRKSTIAALVITGVVAVGINAGDASADGAPPSSETKLVPLGYVEVYYGYNFGRPSNRITNYREFDNRHDSFTIDNAALGVAFSSGPAAGRVVMQVGSVPSSYYLVEPSLAGTNIVNASGPELWKYLQEAFLGYKVPIGRGLLIEAGLFFSPIGPEVVPVKGNWNWSRSNLFAGLPAYDTGLRASYALDDAWSISLGVYNGWNSVVDNNTEKSVSLVVNYQTGPLLAQLLYYGGTEWPTGAPAGTAWRSDFDAYARWLTFDWLSLLAHFNTGLDPNNFGTSAWYAAALTARLRAAAWLYFAARGDFFYEHQGTGSQGTAPPIFWGGSRWVSEGTVTVDVEPIDRLTLMLEYRHDQAEAPLYFRGTVLGSGAAENPFVANSKSQNTLTLGATTWF